MAKFFKVPFASSGTRTTVPDDQQQDGSISFAEGWPSDYERNPLTDPKAKHIERQKMNYLFYQITEAIGELQRQGSSTWAEDRIPYDKGNVVYFGGVTWVSTTANNGDKPGLTASWENVLNKSGGGTPVDPGYTNKEIDNKFKDVYDRLDKIEPHDNGDIYPVSRHSLYNNEYICNGDTIPITSGAGAALNGMSDSFKSSWGIKKLGTTRMKLPMIIPKEDIAGKFSGAIFSNTPGYDVSELLNVVADTNTISTTLPTVTFNISHFLPTMWLKATSKPFTGIKLLFEGTDNFGSGSDGSIKIQQLRFGLYQDGNHYVQLNGDVLAKLSSLTLYDKNGGVINIGGSPVLKVKSTETEVVITVTLPSAVTASSVSINITATVPSSELSDVPVDYSLSLTKEKLL